VTACPLACPFNFSCTSLSAVSSSVSEPSLSAVSKPGLSTGSWPASIGCLYAFLYSLPLCLNLSAGILFSIGPSLRSPRWTVSYPICSALLCPPVAADSMLIFIGALCTSLSAFSMSDSIGGLHARLYLYARLYRLSLCSSLYSKLSLSPSVLDVYTRLYQLFLRSSLLVISFSFFIPLSIGCLHLSVSIDCFYADGCRPSLWLFLSVVL
jgi:hypothetical protein